VLPYLRELVKGGHELSLVTFESSTAQPNVDSDLKDALAKEGIDWHRLKYHKRFSAVATAWDILQGTLFVRRMIRRTRPDILHGRSHVPTLMGALGRLFSGHKPKLIFDIRGFFPEEYVDANVWPENGLIFRLAKRVERWLMRQADGFVVLTNKAKQILFDGKDEDRPVEVIPCCVDFENRFSRDVSKIAAGLEQELRLDGRLVFIHLGALGGLYLTKEIVEMLALARVRDQRVFALFITQSDPREVTRLLKEHGFSDEDFFVGRAESDEVPAYLSISDVGLSFVKATYATQSRSPTKIPEYLAAGLPVVANAGVGDVDQLITRETVGTLVQNLSSEDYLAAIDEVLRFKEAPAHMRDVAAREFALDKVGGERYRRLYSRLLRSE